MPVNLALVLGVGQITQTQDLNKLPLSKELRALIRTNPHNPFIGVEFEYENAAMNTTKGKIDPDLWRCYEGLWQRHQDGSLRGTGIEYVTALGTQYNDVFVRLAVLSQILNTLSPKRWPNARTSVHVHLDMAHSTDYQLGTLLALYVLCERTLFKLSGYRRESIFCTPVRESQTVVPRLLRLIANRPQMESKVPVKAYMSTLRTYASSSPKYLAMNVGALTSHGSLEFRHHAGVYDPIDIGGWIDILTDLHRTAHSGVDFHQLIEEICNLNTNSEYKLFITRYLPKTFVEVLSYESVIQDLIAGSTFFKECLIEDGEQAPLRARLREFNPAGVEVEDDIFADRREAPAEGVVLDAPEPRFELNGELGRQIMDTMGLLGQRPVRPRVRRT